MKHYLTLIVLALAALPVFAAVDIAGKASNADFTSYALVVLGAAALVATRRLQRHQ
jgi:hypothetical protein